MGHPVVSIIINNFNYAQFLDRAIKSALAQRYEHVEVVVVDDGSTDGSTAVIERYGGRCTIVRRRNGGQAAAYNSGFAASRGTIVIFLDADDTLDEGAAQAAVAAWHDDTSKLQFRLRAVDAADRPLGYDVPNLPFARGGERALLRAYGFYPSPPGSGNAYARRLLERLLPMPEEPWRIGADGYLIGLAPLYGDIVSLDTTLGAYRFHDSNHTEGSGLSVAKLRRSIVNELMREAALREHAARLGRPIGRALSLRIPSHCKARLVSLRLAPAGHPCPEDRAVRLVLAGIVAALRFPHNGLAKRLLASIGFPLLAIGSRDWIARHLDIVFVARRRRLRRLMRRWP